MRSTVRFCMGLLCVFLMNVVAQGEVSVQVLLRDSNEILVPVEVNSPLQYSDYGQIMEGTELAIVVGSNTVELDQYMGLYIEDDCRSYGVLADRGPNSIFEAAGTDASIYPADRHWAAEDKYIKGFDLVTGEEDVYTGDWFIFDYDTLDIGDCNVVLYEIVPPSMNGFLIQELRFSHVITRDFDDDGQVNFVDFSILAYYFGTDCTDPETCEGVNLDDYSIVDFNDLALFIDFWLEKTR